MGLQLTRIRNVTLITWITLSLVGLNKNIRLVLLFTIVFSIEGAIYLANKNKD